MPSKCVQWSFHGILLHFGLSWNIPFFWEQYLQQLKEIWHLNFQCSTSFIKMSGWSWSGSFCLLLIIYLLVVVLLMVPLLKISLFDKTHLPKLFSLVSLTSFFFKSGALWFFVSWCFIQRNKFNLKFEIWI